MEENQQLEDKLERLQLEGLENGKLSFML